ncbi:MAG: helix-turn-helix transcriptional regulator [Eubacteriales bacterium]|nr:helix-turn-helix transcriptional regulator [Eubacteriales bacterium]
MVNIGDKLSAKRKARNLTQKSLALQVGVSENTISSYENGTRYPSYDILISLARILHVSTDYLLGISTTQVLDVSDLREEEIAVLIQTMEIFRKNRCGNDKKPGDS